MNPVTMSLRALRIRKGVTALTLTSLALGVALPCAILRVRKQVEAALLQEGRGIDLVIGAKGSPLQLVLSSVHHLDMPTGNIPWRLMEEFREDPRVTATLPVGLGDNLQGYRIVGTDTGVQTWTREDDTPLASIRDGRWFEEDFEAVLGSEVAEKTGLGIGDRFVGAHGLMYAPGTGHDEYPYIITGILEPNGHATDRLIFTTIESVWRVHETDQKTENRMFQSGQQAANTEDEITAVWLRLRSPGLRMWMREEINTGTEAIAAAPVDELFRLAQGVLRPLQEGLLVMAALVVFVSGLAILSTLLQASERRKRDWALLRLLGAHRRDVFWLVWLEALWLTGAGILLGLVLAHLGLALVVRVAPVPMLQGLTAGSIAKGEGGVVLAVALMGGLAGILPAAIAYRKSPLEDLR